MKSPLDDVAFIQLGTSCTEIASPLDTPLHTTGGYSGTLTMQEGRNRNDGVGGFLRHCEAAGQSNLYDASVPIPVMRDEDGNVSADSITVERILSGILTVAAHDAGNAHLDYYRKILLASRPNIKKELTEAAILAARNEEWDESDQMFLSLMGLFGDDAAVVLNRALFLDQRASSLRRAALDKDADALDKMALALYNTLMDAPDPVPDAFFNAGFFYMKSHSFKEAKGCFEAYIALTSDQSDEDMGESGIYKRERAQEVVNYIRDQGVDGEHFQKAYSLINSGHEAEGMEEVRLFLQSNPKVWNAWFLLGWALRRLERYSEAKESFEKALEIAQDCGARGDDWKEALADTYNELSICLMECGDINDAKGALLKALDIDNENPKVMSNLGFVALKEGHKDEARGYFLAALEYDKNDKIALQALKSLQ